MMVDKDLALKQARELIGTRVSHQGQNCTVIEVLEDRFQLILEADNPALAIQSDAYGNARREMRALYYVSLLNEDRTQLAPYLPLAPPNKID